MSEAEIFENSVLKQLSAPFSRNIYMYLSVKSFTTFMWNLVLIWIWQET